MTTISNSENRQAESSLTELEQQWIDFYLHKAADHRNRSLMDIWTMTYDELHKSKDYWSWIFPLPEGNFDSELLPTLSDQLILHVNQLPEAQENVLRSFDVIAGFWGINRTQNDELIQSGGFKVQSAHWLGYGLPHHANITRVITSLSLLGQADLSSQFCQFLLSEMAKAGLDLSQISALNDWIGSSAFETISATSLPDTDTSIQ